MRPRQAGALGGRGGIGRRAGFRFRWRKSWGFESLRPHHLRHGIRRVGWRSGPSDDRTTEKFSAGEAHGRDDKAERKMQVTETLSQGLKREYDISLPASDLADKLNGQLAELKAKVRINGFRPGKVPVEHLRKVYGKSVMADVVQEAIAAANKKIVDDNRLRLAREPKIELPADKAAIDAALEARGDLNFKVALEVLPVFEVGDFSQLALERPIADVDPADIETALDRLAEER